MKNIIGIVLFLFGMLMTSCSSTFPFEKTGEIINKKINGNTITIERVAVPFTIKDKTIFLEGMLYRDLNRTTWQGIVMTHGRRGPYPLRNPDEIFGYRIFCMTLAENGSAVLFLVRRGYGASQGNDSEFLDTPFQSALAAAADIEAGVDFLKTISGVEKDKLVVMGHSQGGWAAIGASCLDMEGVICSINFCGGTNYRNMGLGFITDKVQQDWIRGASELGSKSRIPMIWIYSENDRNHPAARVKESFDAFRTSGGRGLLHILPPYKDNGHNIIQEPSLFLNTLLEDIASLKSTKR
jgi:dienelactone hydrolase